MLAWNRNRRSVYCIGNGHTRANVVIIRLVHIWCWDANSIMRFFFKISKLHSYRRLNQFKHNLKYTNSCIAKWFESIGWLYVTALDIYHLTMTATRNRLRLFRQLHDNSEHYLLWYNGSEYRNKNGSKSFIACRARLHEYFTNTYITELSS